MNEGKQGKRKLPGLTVNSAKRRRLSKQPIVLPAEPLSPTATRVYSELDIRVTPTTHKTPNGKTVTTQQGTPLTPSGITGVLQVRSPLSASMPQRNWLFDDIDAEDTNQIVIQRQWRLSGAELKHIIPYFGYPDGRVPRRSQPAAAFQDKENQRRRISATHAAKQIYQQGKVCAHEWNHIIAHRFCGYLSQVLVYKIAQAMAQSTKPDTTLIANIFNSHFLTIEGLPLSSEQTDVVAWLLTQFTQPLPKQATRKPTSKPNTASTREKRLVEALTALLSMSRHNLFLATEYCNTNTCAYEDEINKKLAADQTVTVSHRISLDPTNYNQPHSHLFYSICTEASATEPSHLFIGEIDPRSQKMPSFEIAKLCAARDKLAAWQDKPGNLLTSGIGLFTSVDYDTQPDLTADHSAPAPVSMMKKIRRNYD